VTRERSQWKSCRAGLAVPFDTYHRNDQPAAIRDALAGVVPAVVAATAGGIVLLVGPDGLDECAGSSDRLVAAIEDAAQRAGLEWTV
jgi:hypothetical protein